MEDECDPADGDDIEINMVIIKLRKGITTFKEAMGVEQIYLYWNDKLNAEPNINGKFFTEWKDNNGAGCFEWFRNPFDEKTGVGDLFEPCKVKIEGYVQNFL